MIIRFTVATRSKMLLLRTHKQRERKERKRNLSAITVIDYVYCRNVCSKDSHD
jgi:hypothetical protein